MEACYLTGSSESCEGRRGGAGVGKLKQKLDRRQRKGRGGVKTPEGL